MDENNGSGEPVAHAFRSELDVHIGRTIRARRLDLGVTEEDLAKSCDKSIAELQSIELGLCRPSAVLLGQIADRLSISVAHFFHRFSPTKSLQNASPPIDTLNEVAQSPPPLLRPNDPDEGDR
jgi:transcriptional regulator with XRE-family HTH domain